MIRTLSGVLSRTKTRGGRRRPVAGGGRRPLFDARVETLEGRALLSATVFAKGFGTTNNNVSVESVALDSTGNEYVTGEFKGTVNLGATTLTSLGGYNIFVAKLDSSGNVVWAKTAGSTGPNDFSRDVAVDNSGNVYVTGWYSGPISFGNTQLSLTGAFEIFVAKLDNSGNFLWAKGFGSTGVNSFNRGQSVAVDASGNVYATGAFGGTVNFGGTNFTANGAYAIYAMKLDGSGNVAWATQMGGPDSLDTTEESGYAIATDAAGSNIYVTGVFKGRAAFGATQLNSNNGSKDAFVAKLNGSGAVQWVRALGGAGVDEGLGIAVDASGNAYATGDYLGQATFGAIALNTLGGSNQYVVKLDTASNVLWAKGFGGNQNTFGYAVAVDSSGYIYTTGQFRGWAGFGGITLSSHGQSDVFVSRLAPNGALLGAESFGSTGADVGLGLAAGSNGKVTIVGNNTATLAFNGIALPAQANGFVIQLVNISHPESRPLDYDGDGKADLTLYNPNGPTSALFVIQDSSNLALDVRPFGPSGASAWQAIPGDYDGDGKADVALYNPNGPNGTAAWVIKDSSTNTLDIRLFGPSGMSPVAMKATLGSGGSSPLTPLAVSVSSSSPAGVLVAQNTTPSSPGTSARPLVTAGARSAVVIQQGSSTSSTGGDAYSSALDGLYGRKG